MLNKIWKLLASFVTLKSSPVEPSPVTVEEAETDEWDRKFWEDYRRGVNGS